MRGFVTIDLQPGSAVAAIWVTARAGGASVEAASEGDEGDLPSGVDTRALNVNAVVVDLVEDPQAIEKVRSLTRSAVVVATEGSDLSDLPVEGGPMHAEDFESLLDETEEQQRRILAAIDLYAAKTSEKTGKPLKPKSVVRPEWLPRPILTRVAPLETNAPQRALTTANFVCAVWRYWLASDDERRLRARPSGRTPSRMTPALRSPVVPDFPPRFAASLREQAVV